MDEKVDSTAGIQAKKAFQRRTAVYEWIWVFALPTAIGSTLVVLILTVARFTAEAPFPWGVYFLMAAIGMGCWSTPKFFSSHLQNRPARLFCPQCSGYLPSNLRWRCKHCRTENAGTDINSFLGWCQHCKTEPDGLACKFCGHIILFKVDGTHALAAELVPVSGETVAEPALPQPDSDWQREVKEYEKEKERLRLKAEIAAMEQRLKSITAPPDSEPDPVAEAERWIKDKGRLAMRTAAVRQEVMTEGREFFISRGFVGKELDSLIHRLTAELAQEREKRNR